MSDASMTLTPTLSRWRGSQNPVPLLLREKGLGDEGLQFNCAYLLIRLGLNRHGMFSQK